MFPRVASLPRIATIRQRGMSQSQEVPLPSHMGQYNNIKLMAYKLGVTGGSQADTTVPEKGAEGVPPRGPTQRIRH